MLDTKEKVKVAATAAYRAIAERAHEAGHAAAMACKPAAMIVRRHVNPLDDQSRVAEEWHEPEGVCGFASVRTKGNTPWGRFAKKELGWKKSYTGGYYLWVSEYNQSYDRKYAYARAYVAVLKENGIEGVWSESRLD